MSPDIEVAHARVLKLQAKCRKLKVLVGRYKTERDAALAQVARVCPDCQGSKGFRDRGDFVDCSKCDGRGAVLEGLQ